MRPFGWFLRRDSSLIPGGMLSMNANSDVTTCDLRTKPLQSGGMVDGPRCWWDQCRQQLNVGLSRFASNPRRNTRIFIVCSIDKDIATNEI